MKTSSFCQEVAAAKAHIAIHSEVASKFQAAAEKATANPNFTHPIKGKNLQDRFNKLVADYVSQDSKNKVMSELAQRIEQELKKLAAGKELNLAISAWKGAAKSPVTRSPTSPAVLWTAEKLAFEKKRCNTRSAKVLQTANSTPRSARRGWKRAYCLNKGANRPAPAGPALAALCVRTFFRSRAGLPAPWDMWLWGHGGLLHDVLYLFLDVAMVNILLQRARKNAKDRPILLHLLEEPFNGHTTLGHGLFKGLLLVAYMGTTEQNI
eukprot:IDg6295t1